MNIIELAKQTGVAVQVQTGKVGGGWDTSYVITPDLERFAALVRAAALEEAIDLVAFHGGSVEIEAAIRALKEKT